MSSDLCLISTFGWYTDTDIAEQLTPISTFGWYFDAGLIIPGDPDLVFFALCIQRLMEIDLTR